MRLFNTILIPAMVALMPGALLAQSDFDNPPPSPYEAPDSDTEDAYGEPTPDDGESEEGGYDDSEGGGESDPYADDNGGDEYGDSETTDEPAEPYADEENEYDAPEAVDEPAEPYVAPQAVEPEPEPIAPQPAAQPQRGPSEENPYYPYLPPQVSDTPAAEATAPAADGKPALPFIKGHLIHPGTRRMLSRFDHWGVSGGLSIIGNDYYLAVTPGIAMYLKEYAFALAVPLNLLLFEGGTRVFGGMGIRAQDWDEVPDYARIIRFFTIGRKEYNLYFTVNTLRPASIGHGMLLDKYQGNIDVDRSMTGVIFDAYNEYLGVQLQANDITFNNRVFGALAFVKPLSLFTDNVIAQSFSVGGEYIGDLLAPTCIRLEEGSEDCVQAGGHFAGNDPYSGESLDHTFVRTHSKTGRFVTTTQAAHAVGLSGELKVYKDERNIDVKIYGTHHRFLNAGGGVGSSAGVLARLNTGDDWIGAFRLRGEYRNFGNGFLPSYFNSLYEIQKYGYRLSSNPYQVTPTKYQAVFGDAANGFAREDLPQRHGFKVEASYGLFAGSRSAKQISFGAGLQDSTGPDDTEFYAHVEFPFLEVLQLFGTYMRVNLPGLKNLISADMVTAENSVLLSGARLQLLPFMFINAHYSRSYRTVRSPGAEYHLGNETVIDPYTGAPSPYFPSDNLFENVQTLYVELEIGWEMDP